MIIIAMIVIVVYIILLICAKVYSPFWFHQPVYHTYDFRSFSKEPFWKKTRPPINGLFCNTKNIVTLSTHDISSDVWNKAIHLIQGHYMDSIFVLNHTSVSSLRDRLYGDSFVSCYYEDKINDVSFLDSLDTESMVGILASRPLVIRFLKYPEKNSILHEFQTICVHEKFKNRNISRNLIQTHIYQHAIKTERHGGYVFQKHADLCKAVVPLVQYQTYTFVLRDTLIHKLPRNYSVRCLNRMNVNLWRGIYFQMLAQFEVSLLPEFQFTLEWLKNERYTIYVTVYTDENIEHVSGVYIFEKTYVSWDNENLEKPHMLRLAASVNFHKRTHTKHVLFFRGFLNCLNSFLSDRKEYGILEIPCISDNDTLLSKWQEKYEMRNVKQSAYYLYNIIYPNSPIHPTQFIIL